MALFGVKRENLTTDEDTELIKCPKCNKMLNKQKVVKKKYVCYECGYQMDFYENEQLDKLKKKVNK